MSSYLSYQSLTNQKAWKNVIIFFIGPSNAHHFWKLHYVTHSETPNHAFTLGRNVNTITSSTKDVKYVNE
jgi:hypothetical protein